MGELPFSHVVLIFFFSALSHWFKTEKKPLGKWLDMRADGVEAS